MYSRTKKIFGTELEILIPKDESFDEGTALEATDEVFQMFDKFDLIFSRFNEVSELSKLNKFRELGVSEKFLGLLKFAIDLSKETDGIFNPLVNLPSIGYSKDFHSGEFIRTSGPSSLNLSDVIIYETSRKVSLKNDAIIDLGGCAKGFAVDEGAKILRKYFANFLINAGGDLYANGKFHGKKWEIGIANPLNENENLQVIEAENAGIATSGIYRRKWDIDGKKYHHLVSGKTNQSVNNDILAVTVVASCALDADVYAKIAFILGEEKGREFLINKKVTGFFILR